MRPRARRFPLTLLCVLLALGLVFSGGGHLLFHGEDHGGGCDACHLVQLQAPAACRVEGLATANFCVQERQALPPRSRALQSAGRPRAPPRSV
jgi:hypothetical protein